MSEEQKPDLKALIEQDKRERIAACTAAIQQALAQHRCRLDVFVVLRQGQVQPQVQVVAEE